jgi:hypothetical protein
MSKKKADDKYINIVFLLILIILVFSLFLFEYAPSIYKAPPSFHEFYGSISCSNSVSLSGRNINVSVAGTGYNLTTTAVISGTSYDVLAQGYARYDPVSFSINGIKIDNTTFNPFSYEQRNIIVSDSTLCPVTSIPGGNSGNSGSSGNPSNPNHPLYEGVSVNITTNPSIASVIINGTLKGQTPLSIKLSKGIYNIRLIKEGYKTLEFDQKVDLDLSIAKIMEKQGTTSNPNDTSGNQFISYFARTDILIINLILLLLIIIVITYSYFYLKKEKQ